MPERDVRVPTATYDRLAAAAAAEGVTVRAYLERLTEWIAPGRPGHPVSAARPEADLRLVSLGIDGPGTDGRGSSGGTAPGSPA
ncbi:hypothetical protein [Streptomyces albogriseolus]|uniref:hypothetical protein n=1 Tax=Streptomyces albogriseolus TaxID=1887 RepID=UPI0037C6F239